MGNIFFVKVAAVKKRNANLLQYNWKRISQHYEAKLQHPFSHHAPVHQLWQLSLFRWCSPSQSWGSALRQSWGCVLHPVKAEGLPFPQSFFAIVTVSTWFMVGIKYYLLTYVFDTDSQSISQAQ